MHKSIVQTKECPKCNKVKEVNEFGRDASRPDGRYSYCKECRRKPNRQEQEIEELAAKGLKKCSLCLKTKPFSAFDSDCTKRFGVTSRCKKCHSDMRRLKAKGWHAQKKEMDLLNESGFSICYRCKETKPLALFLKSKTRRSGVFNLCLSCNNLIRKECRLKRRKATRDYTRWEVFEADNFTCYICEEVLSPEVVSPNPKSLSIDHVVPLSRGGLDERDNVRTACLDCNRRKNDLPLEEYLLKAMF